MISSGQRACLLTTYAFYAVKTTKIKICDPKLKIIKICDPDKMLNVLNIFFKI